MTPLAQSFFNGFSSFLQARVINRWHISFHTVFTLLMLNLTVMRYFTWQEPNSFCTDRSTITVHFNEIHYSDY